MRYGPVEFYNVHELLSGDSHTLLNDEVLAHFRQQGILHLFPTGGGEGGQWFCRLPDSLRRTLNPLAQMTALAAPGCELRFTLPLGEAAVTLQSALRPTAAEVWFGSWFNGLHVVGREPTRIPIATPLNIATLRALTAQRGLPFSPDLVRVVLPYDPPVRLVAIEGEVAPPEPGQAPARRLLMYGSSITHGAAAARPSGTYAMRTAQRLGVDLINLGFGGGAHLEPQMAAYIAGRDDWDLATLELGINILSISVDEFARRVAHFVTTIAAAHPDKPIFCIDVYPCCEEFQGGGQAIAFREVVRAQVTRMGLPNVRHISGARRARRPERPDLRSDASRAGGHGAHGGESGAHHWGDRGAVRAVRGQTRHLAAIRFAPVAAAWPGVRGWANR